MNEHYENYDMDEMEIDLIDFLFYLLRRWKSLVAMILLGAVLGSSFYVVKTIKAANAVVEDYQPDADTEANMKLAAQYWKLYDQQMNYNEHSIVMQMDPNQVYEGTLTYYLAAGEQTERLAQLFTDIVNDPAVLPELKEAAGLACEDQYVKELVSSTMSQKNVDESNVSGNLTNNVVNQVQATVPTDDISNIVIIYQVTYLNQETCEKMVMVLQNEVESAAQKYVDSYGEYEFDQLQNVVAATVDEKYLEKQKSSATLMDSYLTKLTMLENDFNDKDKVYYQKKYLTIENMDVEQSQKKHDSISVKTLIRWLIIGMVGFVAVWGVYYFLKYLLDSSIKTLDEVKQMGLPVIGSIAGRDRNSTILNRLEEKKNGHYESVDYVSLAIDILPEKNIFLVTDFDEAAAKQLSELLEQKNKKIRTVHLLQSDANALELAKESDGIILEIVPKKTDKKQIVRELEVCKMQKIAVIGVIGIFE